MRSLPQRHTYRKKANVPSLVNNEMRGIMFRVRRMVLNIDLFWPSIPSMTLADWMNLYIVRLKNTTVM